MEETDIDAAYLQAASDNCEMSVAGGGTDYRDDNNGAGPPEYSFATQEVAGDEGGYDAGTMFEVNEDHADDVDNEDAALCELTTQESVQDAAPLPAVSASVATKRPPRPTSIAPSPAGVAAITTSMAVATIKSSPTPPLPAASAALTATAAASPKRIAAGY